MTRSNSNIQPTTKTQINMLQRGHGRLGIVGSSYDLRNEIAGRVKWENPETLNIRYKGHDYTLNMRQSLSGKSFWYTSEQLPTDIVREIMPTDTKAIEHPELVAYHMRVNGDMTVEYITFRRTRTTRQWKQGQTIEIAERDITIL